MDTEELWGLWLTVANFINKKDRESAYEEFLQYLYENDSCEFLDLLNYAEEEEEALYAKIIKRFIRENELDEEDY